MRKFMTRLLVASLALVPAASAMSQSDDADRVQALEKRLAELTRELDRLQQRFDNNPFRGFEGPQHGFWQDFDPWSSLRLPGRRPTMPSAPFGGERSESTSLSFRQTPDGVRLEVRTRNAEGKETVKTYEADSIAAFEKQYPELMKKHGLRFGDAGDFKIDLGSRFGFGDPDIARWFERLQQRPWVAPTEDRLGVLVSAVDESRAKELALSPSDGLCVREVQRGTLADRLGLQENDVLLSINGKRIRGTDTIRDALQRTSRDAQVSVTIDRSGKGELKLEAPKTPSQGRTFRT